MIKYLLCHSLGAFDIFQKISFINYLNGDTYINNQYNI